MSDYYYTNGITSSLLTADGIRVMDEAIRKHDYRCKVCDASLIIITWPEGTNICCANDNYHKTGHDILFNLCTGNKPEHIETSG